MRPNVLFHEKTKDEPANVFYTEATADALLFSKRITTRDQIDHGGEIVKDMFIFQLGRFLIQQETRQQG
jgi:hypothetical protein